MHAYYAGTETSINREPENDRQSSSHVQGDQSVPKPDNLLLEYVWSWLTNDTEILVGDHGQFRQCTLAEAQASYPPEHRAKTGITLSTADTSTIQSSHLVKSPGAVSSGDLSNTHATNAISLDNQNAVPENEQPAQTEDSQSHNHLATHSQDGVIHAHANVDLTTAIQSADHGSSAARPVIELIEGSTDSSKPYPDKSDRQNRQQTQIKAEVKIFASEARMWPALTGHGPDHQRVKSLDFIVLSVIAARGPRGILQNDLVRVSGQDKRSVPHRTDRLQEAGYINKKQVMVLVRDDAYDRKLNTSLCTLSRFAQTPEHLKEVQRLIDETNNKVYLKRKPRFKRKRPIRDETNDFDETPKELENDENDEDQREHFIAQWTGERSVTSDVLRVVQESGTTGVTLPEIRRMLFGDEFKKPVEFYTGRLVDAWQISQPLHLRHLAVVRDTVLKGKSPVYIHYTFPNYQRRVNDGQASWEAVRTIPSELELGRYTSASLDRVADVDEHGFPQFEDYIFEGSRHDGSLAECAAVVKQGPRSATGGHGRTTAGHRLKPSQKKYMPEPQGRPQFASKPVPSAKPKQDPRILRAQNTKQTSELIKWLPTNANKGRGRQRKFESFTLPSNLYSLGLQQLEDLQKAWKGAERYQLSKIEKEIDRRVSKGDDGHNAATHILDEIDIAKGRGNADQFSPGIRPRIMFKYAGGPAPAVSDLDLAVARLKIPKSTPRSLPKGIAAFFDRRLAYIPSIAAHTFRIPRGQQTAIAADRADAPMTESQENDSPVQRPRREIRQTSKAADESSSTHLSYIDADIFEDSGSARERSVTPVPLFGVQESSNPPKRRRGRPKKYPPNPNQLGDPNVSTVSNPGKRKVSISGSISLGRIAKKARLNQQVYQYLPSIAAHSGSFLPRLRYKDSMSLSDERAAESSSQAPKPRPRSKIVPERIIPMTEVMGRRYKEQSQALGTEEKGVLIARSSTLKRRYDEPFAMSLKKYKLMIVRLDALKDVLGRLPDWPSAITTYTHEPANREDQLQEAVRDEVWDETTEANTSIAIVNKHQGPIISQRPPSSPTLQIVQLANENDGTARLVVPTTTVPLITADAIGNSDVAGKESGNLSIRFQHYVPVLNDEPSPKIRTPNRLVGMSTRARAENGGIMEGTSVGGQASATPPVRNEILSEARDGSEQLEVRSSRESAVVNRSATQASFQDQVLDFRQDGLAPTKSPRTSFWVCLKMRKLTTPRDVLSNVPDGSRTRIDSPDQQHRQTSASAPPSPQSARTANDNLVPSEPLRVKVGRLVRTGGSTSILRRTIVMDLVEKADGVCPGHKELTLPFTEEWIKRGQTGQPEIATVRATINALCTAGKLRQLTFAFRNNEGLNKTKSMLTLPHVDPNDPKVKELQDCIIKAGARNYLPNAWLFETGEAEAGVFAARAQRTKELPTKNTDHLARLDHHRNTVHKLKRAEEMEKIRQRERLVTLHQLLNGGRVRKRRVRVDGELESLPMTAQMLRKRKWEAMVRTKRPRLLPKGLKTLQIQGTFSDQVVQDPQKRTWSEKPLSMRRKRRYSNIVGPYRIPWRPMRSLPKRRPKQDPLLDKDMPEPTPLRIARSPSPGDISSDNSDSDDENEVAVAPTTTASSQELAALPNQLSELPLVQRSDITFSQVSSPRDDLNRTRGRGGSSRGGTRRVRKVTLPTPPNFARSKPVVETTKPVRRSKPASKQPTRRPPRRQGFYTGIIPSYMDPRQTFHTPSGTFSASFIGLIPVVISTGVTSKITKVVEAYNGPGMLERNSEDPTIERSIFSIAMKTRFEVEADRLLKWELTIPNVASLQYPRWTFLHYNYPHAHRNVINDDFQMTEVILHNINQETNRFITTSIDPDDDIQLLPEPETMVSADDVRPGSKRHREATPSVNSDVSDDPEDVEQVEQGILTITGRRRLLKRRKKAHYYNQFTQEEERRFFTAVIAVRCIAGGIEKRCNWSLIAAGFGEQREIRLFKYKWKYLQDKYGSEMQAAEEKFQEAFAVAYEGNAVPALDFGNLGAFPWKWLIDWYLELQAKPKSISGLPPDRSSLTIQGMSADTFEDHINHYYGLEGVNTVLARKTALNRQAWTQPIEESLVGQIEFKDELSIATTWVRANITASEGDYDPLKARAALNRFPNPLIEQALQTLLKQRIVTQNNKGRLAAGRLYSLHEGTLSKLQKPITASDLQRAVSFKAYLDIQLAAHDSLEWSWHAQNGDAIAILNLLANGRITLRTKDVPLNKWGQIENGYEIRQMDKTRLFCKSIIIPCDEYVAGNPILPLPEPRGRPRVDEVSLEMRERGEGEMIPLWYDIHGNLLRHLWGMCLAAVLCVVHTRPGISAEDVGRSVRPVLDTWEVESILDWTIEAGVAECRVSGERKRYETREWWWMVLGGGEEDGQAFARDGLWPALQNLELEL